MTSSVSIAGPLHAAETLVHGAAVSVTFLVRALFVHDLRARLRGSCPDSRTGLLAGTGEHQAIRSRVVSLPARPSHRDFTAGPTELPHQGFA